MIKNIFMLLAGLGLTLQHVKAQYQANSDNPSEKLVDVDAIHPLERTEASPRSGKVDSNSPHFVWGAQDGRNYKYQVELSTDPEFKNESTIVSEPKDWAFYNPHKALEKGSWYWRYASIDTVLNHKTWSETFSFEIDGSERTFVTPPFGEFVKNVPKTHPRVLATPNQIGNLNFPEEEIDVFLQKMKKRLNEELPNVLIYNNEKVLSKKRKELNNQQLIRFISKKTKEKFGPQADRVEGLLKAYLITGDRVFADEAVSRYRYLQFQYEIIIENDYYNDFTEGALFRAAASVYDNCYELLEPSEREKIRKELIHAQEKSYQGMLKKYNTVISSHLWQHHIRNFFTTSLALVHDTQKASRWLEFVYELWTIRAPVGSGDDGGWLPGNGYMGANRQSLFTMPYLLSKYSGVDFFDVPWYLNVPAYLLYTSPINHIAGGFGDNADIKRETMVGLVEALDKTKDNPYSKLYVEQANTISRYSKKKLDIESKTNLTWYSYQPLPMVNYKSKTEKNELIPKARVFRDVGIAAMHTNIEDPDKNLMVALKSSPYGMVGHAHASQNAFNIQYGGEPLFFRSGYYTSSSDHHSMQSYRHTRAHNAILVNGVGQMLHPSGYGWVARFLNGEHISYVAGDASNAYNGEIMRDLHKESAEKWGVELTKANGMAEAPELTRFRRHLVMLRPNIIVIYDELDASEPVTYDWLIHSRDTLALLSGDVAKFYTKSPKAEGVLTLFSGAIGQTGITDQFYAPAVDWLGSGARKNITYTNHWHGRMHCEKVEKIRFLAIIQVKGLEEKNPISNINIQEGGEYKVDGWEISANLDASSPSSLQITNHNKGVAFSLGKTEVKLGKRKYSHTINGSSILIEKQSKKEISYKESIDEVPNSLIYY